MTHQIGIISDAPVESPSAEFADHSTFVTFQEQESCWEVVRLALLTTIFADLLNKWHLHYMLSFCWRLHTSAQIPQLVYVAEEVRHREHSIQNPILSHQLLSMTCVMGK